MHAYIEVIQMIKNTNNTVQIIQYWLTQHVTYIISNLIFFSPMSTVLVLKSLPEIQVVVICQGDKLIAS